MRYRTLGAILVITTCLASRALPQQLPDAAPAPKLLTKGDLRALDALVQAFYRGDGEQAVQIISPLVRQMSPAKLAEVDEALAGQLLPTVAQMLTDALLAELRLAPQKRAKRLTPAETLLILPELSGLMERKLEAIDADPVLDAKLPRADNLRAYEQLFWQVHVVEKQLENAADLAKYMMQLAGRLNRRDKAQLAEQTPAVAEANLLQMATGITRRRDDLFERQALLQADRLNLALRELAEPELTPEKLLAAYTWHQDVDALLEFEARHRAKHHTKGFQHSQLNDEQFFIGINKQGERAREIAGDLTLKANLLFKGLHWWLKGRYGMGSAVFGLAKSPAAMYSEAAQHGLYLPKTLPKPKARESLSEQEVPVPYYDRRHHYWWAWEDRRVVRASFANQVRKTERNWSPGSYRDTLTLNSYW